MKVVYNKLIPFKGFLAINLFGVLFVRSDARELTEVDINHEAIHTAQMKELLYVGFYLLYLLEWLARWVLNVFDNRQAYRNISFEREAYANEGDLGYLEKRRHYAWLK